MFFSSNNHVSLSKFLLIRTWEIFLSLLRPLKLNHLKWNYLKLLQYLTYRKTIISVENLKEYMIKEFIYYKFLDFDRNFVQQFNADMSKFLRVKWIFVVRQTPRK